MVPNYTVKSQEICSTKDYSIYGLTTDGTNLAYYGYKFPGAPIGKRAKEWKIWRNQVVVAEGFYDVSDVLVEGDQIAFVAQAKKRNELYYNGSVIRAPSYSSSRWFIDGRLVHVC